MRNDLTVIHYTSNKELEPFAAKIREKLLTTIKNLPLISVSQKPLKSFGMNICVGDVGVSYFNLHKQLYLGCKAAKTKFICTTEADCLYPPTGYFDFMPEDESGAYFYTNLYIMWKGRNHFNKKAFSLCAMFANREELVKSLEGYVGHYANNIWKPHLQKFQIPLFEDTKKMKFFTNGIACINFKTGYGANWITSAGKHGVPELPYWGKAEDLQREMFA